MKSGVAIPLADVPPSVSVIRVPGSRHPWTQNSDVIQVLRALGDEENLVVLARRNDEAKAIARHADLRLAVNEGSDQSAVEQVITDVLASVGNELGVAAALVDFMIGCGNLNSESAEMIRKLAAHRATAKAAEVIGYVRTAPNLPGLVRAVRIARRHAAELGWSISHPVSVSTVASLPISVGVDQVRELVFQSQRAAAELAVPPRSASTIHKAKGREFDHVVMPWLDASTFGSDIKDRQLLYVALSRASLRLTLIVPTGTQTPLLSD